VQPGIETVWFAGTGTVLGVHLPMSLQHWSYVAMLAFCLVGTLPLVPAFRLRVWRRPRRLLLTILAAGSPFLVWDLYATHAGHWRFDAAQTLPWRVAGLPLEEIAFFAVIPLATVLTYEAVRATRRQDRGRRPRQRTEVR
jgi:lycopene cyclase domain-containing protein